MPNFPTVESSSELRSGFCIWKLGVGEKLGEIDPENTPTARQTTRGWGILLLNFWLFSPQFPIKVSVKIVHYYWAEKARKPRRSFYLFWFFWRFSVFFLLFQSEKAKNLEKCLENHHESTPQWKSGVAVLKFRGWGKTRGEKPRVFPRGFSPRP